MGCAVGNGLVPYVLSRLGLPLLLLPVVVLIMGLTNALVAMMPPGSIFFRMSGRQAFGIFLSIFFLFFQAIIDQVLLFFQCVKMPNGLFAVGSRRDAICGVPFPQRDAVEMGGRYSRCQNNRTRDG